MANRPCDYAGIKLIRPGVRCCDIAAELNGIYHQYELFPHRTFGYGHSFGVLSRYYGREAGLEVREDIQTVLQPNMVVSMEPMIMIPEGRPGAGGYREHDMLVVTEDGAEDITGFPYGPEHNIIKNSLWYFRRRSRCVVGRCRPTAFVKYPRRCCRRYRWGVDIDGEAVLVFKPVKPVLDTVNDANQTEPLDRQRRGNSGRYRYRAEDTGP